MRFKNELHKRRFMDAIKKMNSKDNTQIAVTFLLTADRQLWNRCRIYMVDNKVPLHRVKLKHVKEDAYVLFCGAKDIAYGTTYISMKDLVDKDVVSRQLWRLIFTALEIKRFGVGIVIPSQQEKEKGGR